MKNTGVKLFSNSNLQDACITYIAAVEICGPRSSVSIATGYGLDRPWSPPSLLYDGYRVFPRGKELLGRDADPSPHLVPLVMKE